ncbi:Hypothetical predicted protein [Pelobates cultripes]|uniref:Uncharacterized protein n=1 Tax=Pelobates cultripes TaxID=61616 RepID=A0AAD1W9K8_PELCU|nr:Hypothetical predicted protein [Pelobates cultripes]
MEALQGLFVNLDVPEYLCPKTDGCFVLPYGLHRNSRHAGIMIKTERRVSFR